MQSSEIRQKFLNFFASKGHAIAPSSSLIPADSSVLFTTAGMQQFKPYFLGEKSPHGLNVVSVQKCVRTSDIDEVGDESHLTFFEMLGNFSFGGYFKKEAIKYAHEFITQEMKLEIDYVTVFDSEKIPDDDWRKNVPFDQESYNIWKNEIGFDESKIRREGIDNFWGPTGNEGPCGPTTEIYCNGVEIWNLVFNEYYCDLQKRLTPLKQQGVDPVRSRPPQGGRSHSPVARAASNGVDTGMGFERLVMVLQKKQTVFETDLFTLLAPDDLPTIMEERIKRIMLDHSRAVAFLISDGVRPSNKEQGYVLRRLIRRMTAHFHQAAGGWFSDGDVLGLDFLDIRNLLTAVVNNYKDFYPNLEEKIILSVFDEENNRFRKALNSGVRELKKADVVDAKIAFKMFESYGLTFEIIKDFANEKAKNLVREDFDKEFEKHQEISRAGAEKKFGGHGVASNPQSAISNQLVKLHTATHLLHQALRIVLGNHVQQRGSDINSERLRFDFSHGEKISKEQIQKVGEIVNQKIKENLPVTKETMRYEEALKSGALAFFREKYPQEVSVYSIGDDGQIFSKEICAGPHVEKTGELGHFEIIKEEASSAGVRRIKAVLR